ncbi:class I SAM-dependent DNA methyltransferase [Amycolatopsis regifaucium]|uniref:Methyltransferase n=1 Tax=Amycolatopsis regifaucium TaxID=546365 RepID=A0A154MMT2_9PSEU|nr:class I SAM-dependent methyltransferase [Amycolatopsis regifaucium]KZB85253.1 methyltransferase [Amycolatopsis regifaucium]OKA04228.1 SAM-dependent methyltransferase [Amycolatopsis regifaucium]SFH98600.1 Methyltransferase domain-containing protein [Amycolatopsis regifaucium]
MTSHLDTIRESYDTVAEDYVTLVRPLFDQEPISRAMLSGFAEQVRGPVADVGCGPGHVTAHLASLGLDVSGVDLSPKMIEIARRQYPYLRFEVGSMTALDVPDGTLSGLVAWWSIFHLPPETLPAVFAEFRRTLVAGGQLLIGFHVGDERLSPETAYGHPVTYDAYLLRPDRIAESLGQSGLEVTARLELAGKKWPQACLLAVAV